jgi:hypothetical protein
MGTGVFVGGMGVLSAIVGAWVITQGVCVGKFCTAVAVAWVIGVICAIKVLMAISVNRADTVAADMVPTSSTVTG